MRFSIAIRNRNGYRRYVLLPRSPTPLHRDEVRQSLSSACASSSWRATLARRVRHRRPTTLDRRVRATPHVPPTAPSLPDGRVRAGPRRGEGASAAPVPVAPTGPPRRSRAKPRPSASSTCWASVNPLALEEFAALEERYKFLSDQLEDLKATRT